MRPLGYHDKQVMSINAQLVALRAFAREQRLHIVEKFIEKQSAKTHGQTEGLPMLPLLWKR